VRDAAVGARLLDHPGAMVILVPKDGVSNYEQPMIQTTLRYTASGSGDVNDMQLEPLSYVQRLDGGPVLTGLAAVVEKTRGHGRLCFRSADPAAQPAIESDFLNHEWDLERLMEGIELAWKVAHTKEIEDVTKTVVRPHPDTIANRDKLRSSLPKATGSGYHPSGTAKMGPADDEDAVVDQHGRVHGVEGLLVADASIFPTIMRANTNIPTIMIGERFGEWLRDDAI
jgi:choline dehydrogenase